jgi:16S rRNA pseudouridine516 synthase
MDKFLSSALGISRTDAKTLLKNGKITVDGKQVTKGDFKFEESSEVKNGELTLTYKKHIYLMMNKPEGILSAATDKRVKTVIDLVPEEYKREGLFPVGRLDKNTTGLLIITDDGDFGHKVTSPKTETEKCYYAELDGEVKEEYIKTFAEGITLVSGEVCKPAILEPSGRTAAYVTVTEGKYHQIKRMFGVVGLGVNRLHRVSIGKLVLPDDLEAGETIELQETQKSLIFDKNRF